MSLADPMEDTDIAKIRGFMSVEIEDRSGDFVLADEFNIESFMAKAVLMYNHRFWRDAHGNEVSIGVVKEMFVATIANIEGDEEQYAVVRLDTNEIVDSYPKRIAPDMRVGMKGVWVTAEITVPEVAQKVRDGELNSFSWRGLAKVGQREMPDGSVQKLLTNIELFEISVVYIPDNPAATFAVAKGIDDIEGDLILYSVRLDRTRFENERMANEYLNLHDFNDDGVHEGQSAYHAIQKALEDFDERKLIVVKLADGVQAVVGPLRENSQPKPEVGLGTPLEDSLLHRFQEWSKQQEPLMSNDDQKASEAVEDPVEEATNESPSISKQLSELADTIATKTAEKMAELNAPQMTAMTETMQSFTDTMKSVGDAMKALSEKQEVSPVEPAEQAADESAEATKDAQKSFNDALKALTAKQQENAAQISMLAKTAQASVDRAETLDKTKGEDPNAMFNSQFNFIPGLNQ